MSEKQQFVHLHLHTEYSLLDGASHIDELIDQAVQLDMPAIAITDHGNMFGVVAFHDACQARGIKPIMGCEVYVAPGSRHSKSSSGIREAYNHLTLLAADEVGYHNLVRLVSIGYTEGFYHRPRIDKDVLALHSAGLVGLSGCLSGEVATYLMNGAEAAAVDALGRFSEIFGKDRFYIEVMNHGIEEQRRVNEALFRIQPKIGLPAVATNDAHYLRKDDHQAHDVLLCIGSGKKVHEKERLRFDADEFYVKSGEEMLRLFPGRPDVIRNTLAIAEQCNFKLGRVDSLPAFDVPAGYTIESYFEKVTRDGFADRLTTIAPLAEAGRLRYPIDAYKDRLDRELSVIKRVGFAGYFLIVWDFIRYARERRIPVGPGRGSAAGSLVAYCLRITDIDPIEYDLIFERFLNEERISPPDIDIDFCESRRGEVIEYVTRKYGRENVAQIITFGTMKARAVVRDVGRVLDMSYADVDKVAKMIPPDLKMTLDKALEESPPLKSAYLQDLKVKELIDISRRLEGTTRHASTHAAGVVISPQPLMDLVPLFKGTTADITTQFDMKGVERIGLLKMDFLGLRTLTLIDNCIKMVEAELGERIDLDTLPLDDARTYELFSQGRTAGLFQFESEGMRDILKRFRPDRLEHLTALNALYRPGPMQMIEDFIKRRHGQTRVTFEVAAMKPILEGTYGVMVYQEQVMQIASALAGFSLGEADILRKAMGKKKADVMGAQMEKFTSGCVARGVPAAKAKRIWDQMETFAGYGFNKSHSAAYAYLAYQTAYLKANYPVFFMAALLTSERANTEKMVAYIGECRDMEIKVRPPDVNESHSFFTVVLRPESATADAPSETPPARPIRRGDIRFGLSAIKNVGEGAVDAILEARKEALFGSLFDFCGRVDLRAVNRRVIESFIKSGCFDSLDHRRASLFASIDRAMEIGQKRQRDREQGQGSLFGLMDMGGGASGGTAPAAADRVPDMPEWHESERLAFEKESLGYFITGHPLDRYREDLAQWGMNSARLAKISEAMDVAIGGLITALRQIKTKKGDWMATFILEDLEGTVEVIVFTEAYKRLSGVLADDLIALVRGKAEPLEEGRVRLLAQEVVPLEEAKMKEARQVVIRMTAAEWGQVSGEKLRDILAAHAGDCPVGLELEGNDRQVVRLAFGNRYRVRPEAALKQAIEELIGSERVTFQRNGGALARPMNGSRAQDGATPQSAVARDEEA